MTPLQIKAGTSLERFFKKQATKWALLGSLLTLGFAIPCILYSAKIASERQLFSTARSAARVFRPDILQNDIRDVQFQMQKALGLKEDESAIIYDPEFKAIFPLKENEKSPPCQSPNKYCWGKGFETISLLYPIYFDDQNEVGLYGYLALTLKPTLDLKIFSAFILLILVAFIGQSFGLSSALKQSARLITHQLMHWSQHLKTRPEGRPYSSYTAPFTELVAMQEAVDGLHEKVDELQKDAAKKAKNEAQVAILREIGHDLRTPHALLAKYFALHIDTVQTTGRMNQVEVDRVLRTLKRMGELLRQVRTVSFDKDKTSSERAPQKELCSLDIETTSIFEDLKNDPDVLEKNVEIKAIFDAQSYNVCIPKIAYYRLLENLVHNSCNAVAEQDGLVTIELKTLNGILCLSVQDNGCGIPLEHQSKVFDLDFTTKPSRGTGLGLTIVKKICEEVGASIHFDSIVDQGTTFTIRFPNPEFSTCEVNHV